MLPNTYDMNVKIEYCKVEIMKTINDVRYCHALIMNSFPHEVR